MSDYYTPKRAKRICIVLAACLILSFCVNLVHAADDYVIGGIKNISGRKYEPAVIELLDGAKESIVISMYSVVIGPGDKNPIRRLLNDLLEARKRGVSVTMYLNTNFRDSDTTNMRLVGHPMRKELEDAGCVIHIIPPTRRLHDKMIIVDGRYTVVGSANWSE